MSNFSAIGFDASNGDAFMQLLGRALDAGVAPADLGAEASSYLWFRDQSGAAIAARLDRAGAIACVTPYFAGPDGGTTWRVRTHGAHLDRDCLHCSGVDCDVLSGSSGEMVTRTAVQFGFFEPYQRWLTSERTFDIRIVGFASALFLCETSAQLESAQADLFGSADAERPAGPANPMRLATEAFLPYGMFGADGHLGDRARALITGSVESAVVLHNELTGTPFVHTRILTLCGPIDVVAPSGAVDFPESPRFALADCWLVGRPVEPPPPKRGFFQRIFGGS